MPTPYIKKLSKEGKWTIKELEDMWSKAKTKAEEEGHKEDWAYVTQIFQSMIGLS